MVSKFNAMEAVNYTAQHRGTLYVLASDYAALESERDEWKRRCEVMAAELSLFGKPSHE